MTTIVCTSDLHEHLVDIPACDLLLIAGDVSFAFKGDLAAKHAFLAGEFKDWLDQVPADEIVLVAGNHDQSIEKWGLPDGLRCHYLQDAGLELFGLRIWGTPWQPWFFDWAFNAPRHDGERFLASKFAAIPAGTDIVVAHGPPRGYGDRTSQQGGNAHVGSTAMTGGDRTSAATADGLRTHPSRLRPLPARRNGDHQRGARRRGLPAGQSRRRDRALIERVSDRGPAIGKTSAAAALRV
jgi:hypothetical protein